MKSAVICGLVVGVTLAIFTVVVLLGAGALVILYVLVTGHA